MNKKRMTCLHGRCLSDIPKADIMIPASKALQVLFCCKIQMCRLVCNSCILWQKPREAPSDAKIIPNSHVQMRWDIPKGRCDACMSRCLFGHLNAHANEKTEGFRVFCRSIAQSIRRKENSNDCRQGWMKGKR